MDTTLHIALANVRLKDEINFIQSVKKDCYERHKNNVLENTQLKPEGLDNLYNPYFYYVYGNYDFAILANINNYDFAQKLFLPKKDDKDPLEESKVDYTYQLITGILNQNNDTFLADDLYKEFGFLGIFKLKLNNGYLVGNGIKFTSSVVDLIRNRLKSISGPNAKFIILHSFSWFEITVLFFSNLPDQVGEVLYDLRSLKMGVLDIADEVIINSHRFNSEKNYIQEPMSTKVDNDIVSLLKKSDIFSDTQSHFCVNCDFLDNPSDLMRNIGLKTEIEWHIKPGHFNYVKKIIEERLKKEFNLQRISMITGRTDFVIEENSQSFENNISIQRLINEENKSTSHNLLNHVSYIKTNVYFNISDKDAEIFIENYSRGNSGFRNSLDFEISISKYSSKLKQLKVSKQCRANVLKMFYLYKSGIQDPVLSIYFFDFYFFIKKTLNVIDEKITLLSAGSDEYDHNNKDIMLNNDVEEFERRLAKDFEIFEKAFNIRMLNSYKYEDISDFNLDFNSSIQQLLSMYNTLVHVIGKKFKIPNNHFLVLVNYRSTVSNVSSINYSIYDFLTPEFIFYSLPKEILNYENESKNKNDKERTDYYILEEQFKSILSDNYSENFSNVLNELLKIEIIDFKYLYIEAIRFYYTFNLRKDCFVYWTWAYLFKVSNAYSITGSLKKDSFLFDLFRIMFTLKLYGFEINDLKCPLPQLDQYWQVYYHSLKNEVNLFFDNQFEFLKSFKNFIINKLNNSLSFNSGELQKMHSSPEEDFDNVNSIINKFFLQIGNNQMSPDFSNTESLMKLGFAKMEIDKLLSVPFDIDSIEDFESENIMRMMVRYIDFIYERNSDKQGGYVNFIFRDWISGKLLSKQNKTTTAKNSQQIFYKIDQTGGVFFPYQQSMEDYFVIRNKMLIKLWDFAMRQTHKIIK